MQFVGVLLNKKPSPYIFAAEGIRRGLSTSNTPAGPTPAAAQNRTGSVLPSCLAYSDPSVGKQTRRRNGWGRIVQEGLLTLLPGAKSGNPLTGVEKIHVSVQTYRQ